MKNPAINRYLAQYIHGSNGMDHEQRIKILKRVWDAMGSEFSGRHKRYEINQVGSQG